MPDNSGRIPIFACVREAWGFLAAHWRLFVPAAAITALISEIGDAFVLLSPPAEGATQTALESFLRDLYRGLPALFASVLFTAAVLRKAIRNEFAGRTGLATGQDEVRLLAVVAALTCVLLPFFALVALVFVTTILGRIATTPEALDALMADPEAFNQAVMTALGETGSAAFALFMMLIVAGVIYLLTRLSMVNAATIGERRVVIFQTWSWSRGNVWPMFAALMLTAFPAVLLTSLLTEFRLAMLMSLPADSGALLPVVISGAVVTFAGALVGIPSVVLGAILYRGLRPPDFIPR